MSAISKKEIFEIAWEKARYGAKKFGGKPSEYFREALRMVWVWARQETFRAKLAKEAADKARKGRAIKSLNKQLRRSLPDVFTNRRA